MGSAMSANPKAAAPRLRAVREAWLGRAIERLEADPAISAAGFVGSLGRGDADDWSDVDLLIVVPDDQVGHYANATQLPRPDLVTWSIDARHNAPAAPVRSALTTASTGFPCTWTGTSTRAPRSPGSQTPGSSSTSRAAAAWTTRSANTWISAKSSPCAQSRESAPAPAGLAHPGGHQIRRPALGRRRTDGRVRRRIIPTRGHTGRVPDDASTAARPVPRRRTRRDAGPVSRYLDLVEATL